MPELSLLSQMAAVARLGETCARGFLDLPFSVGGESCLGAADVDFNEAARRQFRRRAMKATLARTLLLLGAVVVIRVPLGPAWKGFRPRGRGNNLVK